MDVLYELLYTFATFLEICAAKTFFDSFMLPRYQKRWPVNLGILALTVTISLVVSLAVNSIWLSLLMSLFLFLFAFIFYSKSWAWQLFYSLMFYVVIVGMDLLVMGLVMGIFHVPYNIFMKNTLYSISSTMISKLMLFSIMKVFGKIFKRKHRGENLSKRECCKILILLAASVLEIVLLWDSMKENSLSILSLAVFVSSIILNITILNFVDLMTMKNRLIKAVDEFGRLLSKSNQDSQKESMRKAGHDIKAHLTCLYGLIELGEYMRAQKYIESIIHITNTTQSICTQNAGIDFMLNKIIEDANFKGISFKVNTCCLDTIPMELFDMVTLLSNTLENAVQACAQISDEHEKREVALTIKDDPYKLMIRVDNSVVKGYSIEKFHVGTGFGNILEIINKYEGQYSLLCERDIFRFSCILNKNVK